MVANVNLIIDRNRGFTVWGEDEIYTGPEGPGRNVPNVNDQVWSWTKGPRRVVQVNANTGLSVIEDWSPVKENEDTSNLDILVGNGGLRVEDHYYRLYVDKSVTPNTLTVEGKLKVNRRDVAYFKYFLGTEISMGAGHIISRNFSNTGEPLDDRVGVIELESDNDGQVISCYPETTYTEEEIPDGAVVSAVGYNAQGGVISITQLQSMDTSFFGVGQTDERIIVDITLKSPWMKSGTNIMEVPLNLPAISLSITAEVKYRDGTKVSLPIDGNKFSLYGLDDYVTSVPDYNNKMVLAYRLSDGESTLGQSVNGSGNITKTYYMHTLKADHEYNVKLYCYPNWDGNMWRMKYYLMNMDRDYVKDVTSLVEYGLGTLTSFNPQLYGVTQNITVSLNMKRVEPDWVAYRHVQAFQVVLAGEPTGTTETPWVVKHDRGDDNFFGEGVVCEQTQTNLSEYTLDLRSNCITAEEWLAKTYYTTNPLKDDTSEPIAPKPTHFEIVDGNNRFRRPLSDWDRVYTTDIKRVNGEMLEVIWVTETETNDLYLGISGFPVREN